MICEEALALEVDRQRLPSHRDGAPGVSQERDNAWLSDLASRRREQDLS